VRRFGSWELNFLDFREEINWERFKILVAGREVEGGCGEAV